MTVTTALVRRPAERRRLGRGVRSAPNPARRTTRRATRSGTSCSRSSSTSTTPTTPRPTCCASRCCRTGSCSRPSTAPGRCSKPTDLVADLWSVPAYLRKCAPWLSPDEVRALAARGPPGVDGVRPAAARRRPAAARRPGGVPAPAPARGAPSPPSASRWTDVVDDLIAADDSRDAGDVDAARAGPAGRPGRRVRRCPPPTPTCSPGRSRTSSSTRRRS